MALMVSSPRLKLLPVLQWVPVTELQLVTVVYGGAGGVGQFQRPGDVILVAVRLQYQYHPGVPFLR